MIKKLLVGILVSGIALSLPMSVVKADEFALPEQDSIISKNGANTGKVKALIVRLGYKDYPTDNSNKYYNNLNDDILHMIFEGKEGGIGLPFNGLSDYLYTSSYGAMSMEIGDIIDIQMDDECERYYEKSEDNHEVEVIGLEPRHSHEIIDTEEFASKLNQNADISAYDIEGTNILPLYIFDVAGDVSWPVVAEVNATDKILSISEFLPIIKEYAYFRPRSEYTLDNIDFLGYNLRTIIHETGHLLLSLPDYYMFDNYSNDTDDINNVMGTGGIFDYDALSKWRNGWLTNDNIIGIEPDDGETGVVELKPYDSDTPDGKKIAVFKCGLYYIAVDYCGGINNNDISDNLRKKGFRFYILDEDLKPEKVFITDTEDGLHQLFIDGEDLEDIFGKGLTITNIQTGDNPSFNYTYTHKESSLIYNVTIVDEEGNDLTDKADFRFRNIEYEPRISVETGDKKNICKVLHDIEVDEIITDVHFQIDGYESDNIQLSALKEGNYWLVSSEYELGEEYSNEIYGEEISRTDNPSIYNVKLVAKKSVSSNRAPASYILYKVSVLDDMGNDVTDDVEISFDNITDTDSFISYYVWDDKDTLRLYYDSELPQVDTKINLRSVPEGYKESEVVLNLVNFDDGRITVTSPNSNVEVIDPENSNPFEIKITLQKELQEETAQSEQEITEPSYAETNQTEETKELSDGGKTESTDEQMTTSEVIKNNDNGGIEDSSSSEISVKKPRETVGKSSSGNDTKVSVITPKTNGAEAENSANASVEKVPETGDHSNTPIRLTIAGASAGVLATAVIARKRKRS